MLGHDTHSFQKLLDVYHSYAKEEKQISSFKRFKNKFRKDLYFLNCYLYDITQRNKEQIKQTLLSCFPCEFTQDIFIFILESIY